MLFVTMTTESFQSRAQALIYVSLDDSGDSFMAHHRTTLVACLSPHICRWYCCCRQSDITPFEVPLAYPDCPSLIRKFVELPNEDLI